MSNTTSLMSWGPHKFEMKGPTYQTFEKSFAARWQGVEVIGTDIAQQFMGPGEETISLDGVVYPFHFAGFKTLEQMEDDMRAGKPQMLVSGYGKVFGRFALRNLSRSESMIFAGGAPQKIEFTLQLVKVPRA